MKQHRPPDILPEPPEELKQHSLRLLEIILSRIEKEGSISFAQYMEMALYQPSLGYYSAGLHKFGAEGDFVTAPELGDIFAACLARQVAQIAEELGACHILEIGAGSGRLAADLMTELDKRYSGERSYRILETSGDLRAVQQETLHEFHSGAWQPAWMDEPPDEPWSGVIIANEVLDALPVERFVMVKGEVRQICVENHAGELRLNHRTAPSTLVDAVRELGEFPDQYRSEINLMMPQWLHTVTESLQAGVALFVDYGYPKKEFYLPERNDGTLIAHYRHRAHDDVLRYPGLQDLTAFVDFSAVAASGRAANLDLLGYTNQGLFLMSSGLDEVVHERLSGDPESDMAVNNEVRQLVFPGLMGEKFQVMALGRNWRKDTQLRGFAFRDLSNRL